MNHIYKNTMKKYHSFLVLLLCSITVFSLSSCLDDGDDNNDNYVNLSSAQRVSLLYNSAGSYTGKMYYPKNSNTVAADSLDFQMTLTPKITSEGDTCHSVGISLPLAAFKNYVSGTDSTIVKEAGTAEVTAVATPYSVQYSNFVNQNLYLCLFIPTDVTVTQGNNTIAIHFETQNQLSFAGNYYAPYLYLNTSSKETEGYLLVKNVTINKTTYDIERPFILHGKK
jgi:hypothetical protein